MRKSLWETLICIFVYGVLAIVAPFFLVSLIGQSFGMSFTEYIGTLPEGISMYYMFLVGTYEWIFDSDLFIFHYVLLLLGLGLFLRSFLKQQKHKFVYFHLTCIIYIIYPLLAYEVGDYRGP